MIDNTPDFDDDDIFDLDDELLVVSPTGEIQYESRENFRFKKKPKLVLVTGANSLLAMNTIINLLDRGYRVRGMLRDPKNCILEPHSNLELVKGDITNIYDVEQAVKKCHYVIHIAALTEQDRPRYSSYYKTNILASEYLFHAALREMYTVKRMIYVSSANAFGYGDQTQPGNEKKPVREPFSSSYYAKSKFCAQQNLIQLSEEKGLEVVVVNPTFMIGPLDAKPSSGRIIKMGYNKKFIFYPPGGKNFVHVKDVAQGVIAALEKGKNREAYLLANENLTFKAFFEKLNTHNEKPSTLVRVPEIVLFVLGLIGSIFRFLGFKSSWSLANMKTLCVNNFYSNQKAKKELGLSFHSTDEAIYDAIKWFKENKMLVVK